jgi:hypothetical protein
MKKKNKKERKKRKEKDKKWRPGNEGWRTEE